MTGYEWDRSSSIYLFDCESGILAGRITINMLGLYISERVKELTGGKQTPTTTKPQTIPDFPIAVRLGN